MAIRVPKGYRLAAVTCGIKRSGKPDLTLVVSEVPAVAAGAYTTNLVHAAPVALDRQRTPSDRIRAVAINSGNANACTGQRGMDDAREMARLAATACGGGPEDALVLSTGIIGEFMPMDKIARGVPMAVAALGNDDASLLAAAQGIMTTDTVHKLTGRTLALAGRSIQITGFAKGAGMIAPNLATMLCVIFTDAPLAKATAQEALSAAVGDSFNCITIDGHMSTNDTVLLLANGAAGGAPLAGDELAAFRHALDEVCVELARAIPSDGEGTTHLVTLDVAGCATRQAAYRIAKSVCESPLVKTAIAGADPNWGRIVSAAGYAGVPFDPAKVSLHVNGTLLYENGAPVTFDGPAVAASMRDNREVHVLLELGEGDAKIRFWTTDLTVEYVQLNADYHT